MNNVFVIFSETKCICFRNVFEQITSYFNHIKIKIMIFLFKKNKEKFYA